MPIRMVVVKYIPDSLYGFARDPDGNQVFFHQGVFQPGETPDPTALCTRCTTATDCTWSRTPPPPVLGEEVDVEVDPHDSPGKAPRAQRVTRVTPPRVILGHVDSFDPHRGFGFARGDDQVTYHLHKSEIADGRIPLTRQTVVFYAGVRLDKPRACHVRVCP